jgi:RNA polymerase sigma-70 factor, ECF subfamily
LLDKSSLQSPGSSNNDCPRSSPQLRLEEPWPQTLEEFRALVRKYQHRLVRYATYRLGNRDDAEDVIQKIFTKAFLERKKRKKIRRVGPYLYRMAANACTDHLRINRRTVLSLEDIPDAELAEEHEKNQSSAAMLEIRKIEGLLRCLPEKQAEVIRLFVIEQLGPTEVAEIFGCSINTVKSRFRYGIEKLRGRVARDMEVQL